MSDREDDPQNQAIDPPENTGGGNMSMDSPEEEPAVATDPPENTKTKETRE